MSWKKTGCALCNQGCGLEVLVEDNRIVKVRPDKENPRSQGYSCRKGLKIAHYQHHADRLTHPLKRVGDDFQRISWDQALDEIALKLKGVLEAHGPRAVAYMGGGGQGCHFEASFGRRFFGAFGCHYHYNALAQEHTGMYWVHGRTFGRQYLHPKPDIAHSNMLLVVGWNPMMSHQIPQARRKITAYSKDPNKLLVVIDPRESETAGLADIHLALRPGTDALLLRSMIAIILENGWRNQDYLDRHVSGFDRAISWFTGFDYQRALKVCELEFETVRRVCSEFVSRQSCLKVDLGILMNRHSTLLSYLEMVLLGISGRLCVPGGNVLPGSLIPIGSHTDERDEANWRTIATNYPAITGLHPPNVMPEEIMNDHPERLRAVIVSGANPLRSFADTTAYEQAFKKLDLLVTVELAMTETAVLSDYVLPAKSAYESWDGTFFTQTYPDVYFQMRRPVVEPVGEPVEAGEVFVELADRLGLIPEMPDTLHQAARKGNRLEFGLYLMDFFQKNPQAQSMAPFVLSRTLGQVWGSSNLAVLWGLLNTMPKRSQENAVRAGFSPGPAMGDAIFQTLMDNPQGAFIGRCDPEANFEAVETADHRLNLEIPELADWLKEIEPEAETAALEPPGDFPLILLAGRHADYNANSIMRDPVWNEGHRACTLLMNPKDAEAWGLKDGQTVRVTTEAGEETVELEVSRRSRPGQVVLPHGFGMIHQGKKFGANVNRLTKNTHRDRWAGTPYHRFVPCRIEAA